MAITPVHAVSIRDLFRALAARGLSESDSRSEKSVIRVLQENPPSIGSWQARKLTYRPLALRRADLKDGRTVIRRVCIISFLYISEVLSRWFCAVTACMSGTKWRRSHHQCLRSQKSSSTTHIVTTGLSSNLRPQYFSSYPTPPSTPGPSPSALSALLPGKHSAIGYGSYSSYNGLPTPPGSPNLALKGTSDRGIERLGGIEKDREHQEQSPALAMLAGQTLFKRLGGVC